MVAREPAGFARGGAACPAPLLCLVVVVVAVVVLVVIAPLVVSVAALGAFRDSTVGESALAPAGQPALGRVGLRLKPKMYVC